MGGLWHSLKQFGPVTSGLTILQVASHGHAMNAAANRTSSPGTRSKTDHEEDSRQRWVEDTKVLLNLSYRHLAQKMVQLDELLNHVACVLPDGKPKGLAFVGCPEDPVTQKSFKDLMKSSRDLDALRNKQLFLQGLEIFISREVCGSFLTTFARKLLAI